MSRDGSVVLVCQAQEDGGRRRGKSVRESASTEQSRAEQGSGLTITACKRATSARGRAGWNRVPVVDPGAKRGRLVVETASEWRRSWWPKEVVEEMDVRRGLEDWGRCEGAKMCVSEEEEEEEEKHSRAGRDQDERGGDEVGGDWPG